MAGPPPRDIPDDEDLFRVLFPGLWSPESGLADYTAFLDEGKDYEGLSVFRSSLATPEYVLKYFCGMKGIRAKYSASVPSDLFRRGFGVAAILAGDVRRLGLDFERNADGSPRFRKDGHIDIMRGQEMAADLALVARVLTHSEIFT